MILTKEYIKLKGFVEKPSYSPERLDFEYGDVWNIGGAFLSFHPSTFALKLTTVGPGYNANGPNHSVKFDGIILTEDELDTILRLTRTRTK